MYIPAQGTGVPAHTAPLGALYFRTSTSLVYIQTAGPTGSTWTLLVPVSTGMSDLVDDTTPQLGGDLDLNGHVITGLEIGADVQAYDADLEALAALGSTGFAVRTAANTWAQRSITGTGRVTIADGNGVGGNPAISIDLTGTKVSLTTEVTGTLPIANGGTGATTARGALTNLGTLKATTVAWTGSGSSGKTVTLTGINRAYFIRIFKDTGTQGTNTLAPAGATGANTRRYEPSGATDTTISLNAPSAGTSQVMTINNNYGDDNSSAQGYHALIIGTST